MAKHLLIEKYVPAIRLQEGYNSNYGITLNGTSANLVVGGTGTITGALSVTGNITAGGSISQSGTVPTVYHSGQLGFSATTAATQTKLVTTDTYYCEVFIPANATITGISVLNGHTTSASGNLNVGLANAAGTIVASSATTTAQGAADAYQQIAFSAPYAATGPAKYYIAVQGSQTTGYIATHTIGNFGASLKTTETYGTFVTTASYSTTTFTTADGVIADTY